MTLEEKIETLQKTLDALNLSNESKWKDILMELPKDDNIVIVTGSHKGEVFYDIGFFSQRNDVWVCRHWEWQSCIRYWMEIEKSPLDQLF